MKTNFQDYFFRMPGGGLGGAIGAGIGAAGGASAAFPWSAALQLGGGLLQAGIGLFDNSEKKLERMKSPTYSQNKSIMDYYNTALQRYNVDPYSSSQYQLQKQNANRGLASGLKALQDRRSAIAGVSGVLQGYNDSLLRAGAAAEGERNQRFGQLGQAAGMKANEDDKAFQINEQAPFERKYNLLAMKAAGRNQMANAGLTNIFGASSANNQYRNINQTYGG